MAHSNITKALFLGFEGWSILLITDIYGDICYTYTGKYTSKCTNGLYNLVIDFIIINFTVILRTYNIRVAIIFENILDNKV